jgi:hypothetical protein
MELAEMTQTAGGRYPRISRVRTAILILGWFGVVFLAAPRLGLYYETAAAWYALPPLGMTYLYCATHPSRAAALLAAVATLAATVVIGLAVVIREATASSRTSRWLPRPSIRPSVGTQPRHEAEEQTAGSGGVG